MGNNSQGLCLHTPDCRLSSGGRNRGLPLGHNGKGDASAVHRNPCRGPTNRVGIRVVENRFSVVWEPGQHTTLGPWYPLNEKLGLTHPDQSNYSHFSKNRELWLPFLPWLVSQSEVGTSLGQSDGRLGRGWRVLFTGGLGAHAQDVLEPLAEWFYATEYNLLGIPSISGIVVVFFN